MSLRYNCRVPAEKPPRHPTSSSNDAVVGAELAAELTAELRAEFDAASRRDLRTRFRYGFVRTHKPVMDNARFRAFGSMREYREWCEANLPSWLGYGRI